MSKHTPGPWKVRLSDNATPHILHGNGYDVDDLDHRICCMPAEIMRSFNSLANARLIAAAPDLLNALIHMRKVFMDTEGSFGDYENNALDGADAAIAKATGEQV